MSTSPSGAAVAIAQSEPSSRRRSREKTREELQLAMRQINDKGLKLSISAVATEVGVSASLIHNTYPDIAEEIRAHVGRSTRQQRDAKTAELTTTKAKLRALRAELRTASEDVARLASINETLRQKLTTLEATSSGKVFVLAPQG